MHGLLIVEDKPSMSHGLETRVPFLDNDLVDFAVKLPTNLKINMMKINRNIDEMMQTLKGQVFSVWKNCTTLCLIQIFTR